MRSEHFPSCLLTNSSQIELEQILGLNQDLAPSNYITADVPSKVQKVSSNTHH